MLVPASLLQSVECSTECKNSIFHCTIGCNKYKSSLASGAVPPPWGAVPPPCTRGGCSSPAPGGVFLPPAPPPPAWVHAAHRHGMVSPRKVWFQRRLALFKSSSGSRGGCGTGFRTLQHVTCWFQQVTNKVYDAHSQWKSSHLICGIGVYKCTLLLASGASPQTPPGGLFLPPGPPPPAWVNASHRHGLGHQLIQHQFFGSRALPQAWFWFQREALERASGRYACCTAPPNNWPSVNGRI